jgi:hypothetical protein
MSMRIELWMDKEEYKHNFDLITTSGQIHFKVIDSALDPRLLTIQQYQ